MSDELAVSHVRLYDPKMVTVPPPKTGKAKSFQVRISAADDEKLMKIMRHGPYSQNGAVIEAIDVMYRAIIDDEKAAQKKSSK